MRCKRLIQPRGGFYHLMSRTVNGERLFANEDRETLRRMLWQVADFSGLKILTYCILSNHFHILIEAPAPATEVSDEELVRRYRALYRCPTLHEPEGWEAIALTLSRGGAPADALRRRLLARMHDVSIFMKTLKQRFSVWYNQNHRRFGTLWAERFKSLVVEGDASVLLTVGAYIDLNPVRAGLVEDPKDYRFCGYAEAVAGQRAAVRGVADYLGQRWGGGKEGLEAYRCVLFGKGAAADRRNPSQAFIDRGRAVAVLERGGGDLSLAEVLRCRVRYFVDGHVLGRSEFVAQFGPLLQKVRQRKTLPHPRPMQGGVWSGLTVINGLRQRIFS